MTFGIHYWRPEPRLDCPLLPFPDLATDNHDMPPITKSSITEPYGYVDSDWAGDINTQNKVTVLALMPA